MRLFRRRPRTATPPYAPRHSGWAEPALPPAPVRAEPLVGVRLGFADGTEVELDHSHPSAVALRSVADVIARDLA